MPRASLADYIFKSRLLIGIRDHIWILMIGTFIFMNWGQTLPSVRASIELMFSRGDVDPNPSVPFDQSVTTVGERILYLIGPETVSMLAGTIVNFIIVLGGGLLGIYILDRFQDFQMVNARARRHHRRMVRREFKDLEIQRRIFVTLDEKSAFLQRLLETTAKVEDLLLRYEKNAHALSPDVELATKLSDNDTKIIDLFSQLEAPKKTSRQNFKKEIRMRFKPPSIL